MGVDSLTFIRLQVELETMFNIELDDEDLYSQDLSTARKFINYIDLKL